MNTISIGLRFFGLRVESHLSYFKNNHEFIMNEYYPYWSKTFFGLRMEVCYFLKSLDVFEKVRLKK